MRPQLGARKNGQRGASYKDMYYLTPKAFKICLISSENETKYRDYYLFLEECIYYYNIGQVNAYKEKIEDLEEDMLCTNEELGRVEKERNMFESEKTTLVVEKSDLVQRLDQMQQQMQQMQLQNQTQLSAMQQQMTNVQQQNTTMQGTLDKIVKKLDDRAVPPSDDELTERFALMKKDSNTFYVIRSQERRMPKAIREKLNDGYSKVPDLLESELIPNSIYLWNCIKDELVKERKIKCRYNEITLKDITETDLIGMVKQVFDSRRTLN